MDIGRQPAILAESSDPRQIHIPRETWYQFSPVCSEAAGQLCVVDGAPALSMLTTRVLLERILAPEQDHANDMHDLLVSHEGRPMLEK